MLRVPDFQLLKAWQKAHQLVLQVYEATAALPVEETYGIRQQIRRAAVSCAANIAEGQQRSSLADFAHFLDIAAGSGAEVQYYLILLRDLGYIDAQNSQSLSALAAETLRVIYALHDSVAGA